MTILRLAVYDAPQCQNSRSVVSSVILIPIDRRVWQTGMRSVPVFSASLFGDMRQACPFLSPLRVHAQTRTRHATRDTPADVHVSLHATWRVLAPSIQCVL